MDFPKDEENFYVRNYLNRDIFVIFNNLYYQIPAYDYVIVREILSPYIFVKIVDSMNDELIFDRQIHSRMLISVVSRPDIHVLLSFQKDIKKEYTEANDGMIHKVADEIKKYSAKDPKFAICVADKLVKDCIMRNEQLFYSINKILCCDYKFKTGDIYNDHL